VTAAAPSTCRACAVPVPEGALRCPSCGAAQGTLDPCPLCNAQAGTSPHGELRWVCDVCGGPRVPRVDRGIKLSGREAALLRKADAARKARAAWRGGAIASGLLMPFVALFFLALMVVFGMSVGLILTSLVFMAPVAGFFAYAAGRAGARGREIGPAIDAAWISAATDIAQQARGPISAADLSKKLGVEEPQAEELMALLDVNDALSPRARIVVDPPSPGSAASPTQLASAEEEAAAIEQSAAEAEALRRKGGA
jgi:hypothetical protein